MYEPRNKYFRTKIYCVLLVGLRRISALVIKKIHPTGFDGRYQKNVRQREEKNIYAQVEYMLASSKKTVISRKPIFSDNFMSMS